LIPRLHLRSFRSAQKAAPRTHTEPYLSVLPLGVGHIGLILREGRENVGVSLQDVANTLCIRYIYLQAIEDGRFDKLPGPAYATGFLRAYSDFLGFDTERFLKRFRAETGIQEQTLELDFPDVSREGRFPGSGALLVSLVVATVVFGSWYYSQIHDEFRFEHTPTATANSLVGGLDGKQVQQMIIPIPDTLAEGVRNSFSELDVVGSVVPELSENRAAPELAEVPDHKRLLAIQTLRTIAPAATDIAIEDLPRKPEKIAARRLPAVPRGAGTARAGRVYGMTNLNTRIIIVAEVDSWIQVRNASRTGIFTRVLRPGDSYWVPNENGLSLMTGNAGGLRIKLDGAEGRPLGAEGEVVRDVPLDPDLLRAQYLR